MLAHTQECSDDVKDILVLYHCHFFATFVAITTTLICSRRGGLGCVELQLSNVQNCREDLADVSNFVSREFQFAQGSLEVLEAFRVVDADLQLGRVSEVSPSLLTAGEG